MWKYPFAISFPMRKSCYCQVFLPTDFSTLFYCIHCFLFFSFPAWIILHLSVWHTRHKIQQQQLQSSNLSLQFLRYHRYPLCHLVIHWSVCRFSYPQPKLSRSPLFFHQSQLGMQQNMQLLSVSVLTRSKFGSVEIEGKELTCRVIYTVAVCCSITNH